VQGAAADLTAGATSAAIRGWRYERAKRLVDVAGSALLLVASLPVMAALAVCVWTDSGRPVLISQVRVGRWKRPFRLWKFRTLPPEALQTAEHAWAVEAPSKLMRFIRRGGLDELPQLINVLRGEMSLVGPRPERPHFATRFEEQQPGYALRHQLLPGITGLAQVRGWRGDTPIARRLEQDLRYLSRWSLGLDLRILATTLTVVGGSLLDSKQRAENRRNARVV
jgi:lipopolysaccharide/colanic/teichoic acid biosynthesis glycosyltransferase